jgi:thymidylate synthase
MAELRVPDMRVGYKHLIEMILNDGEKVVPRGQPTREILGFTLRVDNPCNSVLTGVRAGYNAAIGAAEAAQLIGGVSHPALMVRISKNFGRFLDAGSFHGAYGPRIKTQLPTLAKRLNDDHDTRQAIAQIWRPQDDLWGETVDLPCTLGFQFFVRNDSLIMHTRMRSNDVNWGIPYDVFQFTQLQLTLSNVLNLNVGEYIHTVGSMHIYERDIDSLLDVEEHDDTVNSPYGFGIEPQGSLNVPDLRMKDAMLQARHVIENKVEPEHDGEVDWYVQKLAPYFNEFQGMGR